MIYTKEKEKLKLEIKFSLHLFDIVYQSATGEVNFQRDKKKLKALSKIAYHTTRIVDF